MNSTPERLGQFIPGVEALRGIAVLAVILYHFDQKLLPSGYLGVDLFFVISGFVVTGSLYKMRDLKFLTYLVTFYIKRFRRLYPVLFVFVVVTFLCLVLIDQYDKQTLRTGALSLVGLANLFLIYTGDDYFALHPDLNLFTHTWSLGIEEQFYLVLPLFLFAFSRSTKLRLCASLLVLFCSFAFYLYQHDDVVFQYYSPFTRGWQLIFGSVMFQFLVVSNYRTPNVVSLVLFFFVIGMFIMSPEHIIITTPLISVCAGLLIYSLATNEHKWLSSRYLVYVGTISYSLYLFHFPIIRLTNFPGLWNTLTFVSLFAISALTYRFVERPFRYRKLGTAPKTILLSSLCVLVVAGFTSLIVFSYAGDFEKHGGPFSPPDRRILNQCTTQINQGCVFGSESGRPSLYFVGDSHSLMLSPTMVELNKKDGLGIYSMGTEGLFTVSMITNRKAPFSQQKQNRLILEFILSQGFEGDAVVVSNQLMNWFSETYNDDPKLFRLMVQDKIVDRQEALLIYFRELQKFSRMLDRKKMSLIIFAPFPDFRNPPQDCYSPFSSVFQARLVNKNCRTTRLEQDSRRQEIVNMLQNLANNTKNVKIIDPIEFVCDNNYCSPYIRSKPVYLDDDHINYNLTPIVYSAIKQVMVVKGKQTSK